MYQENKHISVITNDFDGLNSILILGNVQHPPMTHAVHKDVAARQDTCHVLFFCACRGELSCCNPYNKDMEEEVDDEDEDCVRDEVENDLVLE